MLPVWVMVEVRVRVRVGVKRALGLCSVLGSGLRAHSGKGYVQC